MKPLALLMALAGCAFVRHDTAPAPGPNAHWFCVKNFSKRASDSDVARWAAAIQVQLNRDVAPEWTPGRDWGVHLVDNTSSTSVLAGPCAELRDSGDPMLITLRDDAKGEHYPSGLILVDVNKTLNQGDEPSKVLSHELIEWAANPNSWPAPKGTEIADPLVGRVNETYTINGVTISNFVKKDGGAFR